MRFRLGLGIGFGAGYYLGAKAGRERYEQLNEYLGKAKRSEVVETATEKAKAVIDLGVERARDMVDRDEDDTTTVVVTTEPLVNGRGSATTGQPTYGTTE